MRTFASELSRFESLQKNLSLNGYQNVSLGDHAFLLKSSSSTIKHTGFKPSQDIDLLILGLIHGNEVAGLSSINDSIEKIKTTLEAKPISVAFVLGNVPAGHENVRFREKDLNRIFGTQSIETKEDQRARFLEDVLKRTKFVLDIHQTIEPTEYAFFIFGFESKSYQWARALAPQYPIISYSIEERRPTGLVATSYAIDNGSIACTVELGQKGFDDAQINKGVDIIQKSISLVQSSDLMKQMNQKPSEKEEVMVFAHRIPNEGDLSNLNPGYTNFKAVKAGEKMGKGSTGDIICPINGRTLFPKYGTAKKGSKELCVILEATALGIFLERHKLAKRS